MLRILPQKPLEVVSVQAAAGSIIHKAMRVFYQSRKVELEEYRATSMLLWEYTEMEWEHGPFSAARGVGGGEGALDIKQEQMERSTIPETTLYIKRGQMERDLLLCAQKKILSIESLMCQPSSRQTTPLRVACQDDHKVYGSRGATFQITAASLFAAQGGYRSSCRLGKCKSFGTTGNRAGTALLGCNC